MLVRRSTLSERIVILSNLLSLLLEALWSNNLLDTDTGLQWFFEACVEAGPERCGLYESSAEKVKARLEALFARLKVRPIAVSKHAATDLYSIGLPYGLVDYALVRWLVFRFLYTPYARLNVTANFASSLSFWLNEAEKGNGEPIWTAVKENQLQCRCSEPMPESNHVADAGIAILCGDGEKVEDTVEELEEHQARLAQESSFGELWTIRAVCV